MWDRRAHQLALLELVATGRLRRRQSQAEAWTWLAELSWTHRTGRQNEIALEETRFTEAKRLLDQVWPNWTHTLTELEAAGLPVNERGWRQLQGIGRSRDAPGLPPRLNRRTALANVGEHSKSTITFVVKRSLAATQLTHDGIVRLRPSAGLRLQRAGTEIDADAIVDFLGEVVLTERALIDGTSLTGTLPQLLLTVENLGPYLDISVPAECLVAHVAGWDTRSIRMVFELLPSIPVLHFGDLDPNGWRIVQHLRTIRQHLSWLVPPFWEEFIEPRGLHAPWPKGIRMDDAPPILRALAESDVWLEQESIALDPRLCEAIREYCTCRHP